MQSPISIIPGQSLGQPITSTLAPAAVAAVSRFHQSLPNYQPTPLVSLPALAKELSVGAIFIKDEAKRFGLNAFKGLGAAYAMATIIANYLHLDAGHLDYRDLTTPAARQKLKDLVFITTTDGNHGKGVAWAAAMFGCRAIVLMPRGSQACRAEAIRAINGTRVEITDLNYDDAVRRAARLADENGYLLIQDTALAGYADIPNAITRGYTTMAAEALAQLDDLGIAKPSHVFLQAGVGSMAGGVLGYLAHYYNQKPPLTTIVEPDTVACLYQSVASGQPASIGGHPETIMAGLNCGEPNPLTWPILRDYASFFARCPDWVTILGMQTLAWPEATDPAVISGESGAVGLGLLVALCRDQRLADLKAQLQLYDKATILLFSTEGNTDPEGYAALVSPPRGIV
ncbi:MAG: diaminopropionate ammonia-lyase [Acetobacterium sp. MES1]|uniref:diaminopropionate ammonia-lyase n=1 Tax=Acetobacterium sp. MES1 TaxID=1899015 RepID=UPI000B9CE1C8|nr:diaminopropionate ammonia-lyase [Acetobacterium sp. MES1]OXS25703.1 MAG: diaminopropionate ammonia-lyase [Acetobacterium sp. MES1]